MQFQYNYKAVKDTWHIQNLYVVLKRIVPIDFAFKSNWKKHIRRSPNITFVLMLKIFI